MSTDDSRFPTSETVSHVLPEGVNGHFAEMVPAAVDTVLGRFYERFADHTVHIWRMRLPSHRTNAEFLIPETVCQVGRVTRRPQPSLSTPTSLTG